MSFVMLKEQRVVCFANGCRLGVRNVQHVGVHEIPALKAGSEHVDLATSLNRHDFK